MGKDGDIRCVSEGTTVAGNSSAMVTGPPSTGAATGTAAVDMIKSVQFKMKGLLTESRSPRAAVLPRKCTRKAV